MYQENHMKKKNFSCLTRDILYKGRAITDDKIAQAMLNRLN